MRYSDRTGHDGEALCLKCGRSLSVGALLHADGSPICPEDLPAEWQAVFAPGRASLPTEERASEIEAKLRLNIEPGEFVGDRRIGIPWVLILFVIAIFAAVAGCLWYAWLGIQ
jgi:hypothetical protein